MADLTIPDFAAALPAPRVFAPQSNTLDALTAGVLEASKGISDEFTNLEQVKLQTKGLADALGQDPESAIIAEQFRAIGDNLRPNFLAASGQSMAAKLKDSLLEDATAIIRGQAALRSREGIAAAGERGAGERSKLDANTRIQLAKLGREESALDREARKDLELTRQAGSNLRLGFSLFAGKTADEQEKEFREITTNREIQQSFMQSINRAILNRQLLPADGSALMQAVQNQDFPAYLETIKDITPQNPDGATLDEIPAAPAGTARSLLNRAKGISQ